MSVMYLPRHPSTKGSLVSLARGARRARMVILSVYQMVATKCSMTRSFQFAQNDAPRTFSVTLRKTGDNSIKSCAEHVTVIVFVVYLIDYLNHPPER